LSQGYKVLREDRDYIRLEDGSIIKSMHDGRYYDADYPLDHFAQVQKWDNGEIVECRMLRIKG